ncbi:MAG: Ig-like domain-containing protein [Candidatus Dormibacteraceae bacterium]
MRKTRFLTRLSSGAFVVAVAAGSVLFTDGVSAAAATAVSPQVELNVSAASVTYGTPVTLTAKINQSDALGAVQFKDANNTLADATVHNGQAWTLIPHRQAQLVLTPGEHLLTAVFKPTPTDSVTHESSAVRLEVTPQATILTAAPGMMHVLSLSNVEFAAKLTEAPSGEPVAVGIIEFYGRDGTPLCHAFTESDGWARCSGAEGPLGHTVELLGGYKAVFPGNTSYYSSEQHSPGAVNITGP